MQGTSASSKNINCCWSSCSFPAWVSSLDGPSAPGITVIFTHCCRGERVRWLLQQHRHVLGPKPPPSPGGRGRQLLPHILLFSSSSSFNVAHSSAVKDLFLSTLICFAESMVGIFWCPFLCEDVAPCHASPDNGALPNDSHWHIKHDVVMGIMYRPLLF